jgi:hypothetical protein
MPLLYIEPFFRYQIMDYFRLRYIDKNDNYIGLKNILMRPYSNRRNPLNVRDKNYGLTDRET